MKENKQSEYYRLVRNDRNMFSVETITVVGSKIIASEQTEPSFLPIAFDQLRRRTGKAFFDAHQENAK